MYSPTRFCMLVLPFIYVMASSCMTNKQVADQAQENLVPSASTPPELAESPNFEGTYTFDSPETGSNAILILKKENDNKTRGLIMTVIPMEEHGAYYTVASLQNIQIENSTDFDVENAGKQARISFFIKGINYYSVPITLANYQDALSGKIASAGASSAPTVFTGVGFSGLGYTGAVQKDIKLLCTGADCSTDYFKFTTYKAPAALPTPSQNVP